VYCYTQGIGIKNYITEECIMADLPEDVSRAWDDREGPVVFTTVDKKGMPNSIYVTCVKKYSDDKIVIADNYFNKTRVNIKSGCSGSVLFITKDKKSYQIKGPLEYHTDGAVYNDMKKWLDSRFPGVATVSLTVKEVYCGGERLL